MWITSNANLPEDPRLVRLAAMLGISVPQAIGHLHCLWYFCARFQSDGDLTGYTAEQIAEAGKYRGDAAGFCDALRASAYGTLRGFLHTDEVGRTVAPEADDLMAKIKIANELRTNTNLLRRYRIAREQGIDLTRASQQRLEVLLAPHRCLGTEHTDGFKPACRGAEWKYEIEEEFPLATVPLATDAGERELRIVGAKLVLARDGGWRIDCRVFVENDGKLIATRQGIRLRLEVAAPLFAACAHAAALRGPALAAFVQERRNALQRAIEAELAQETVGRAGGT